MITCASVLQLPKLTATAHTHAERDKPIPCRSPRRQCISGWKHAKSFHRKYFAHAWRSCVNKAHSSQTTANSSHLRSLFQSGRGEQCLHKDWTFMQGVKPGSSSIPRELPKDGQGCVSPQFTAINKARSPPRPLLSPRAPDLPPPGPGALGAALRAPGTATRGAQSCSPLARPAPHWRTRRRHHPLPPHRTTPTHLARPRTAPPREEQEARPGPARRVAGAARPGALPSSARGSSSSRTMRGHAGGAGTGGPGAAPRRREGRQEEPGCEPEPPAAGSPSPSPARRQGAPSPGVIRGGSCATKKWCCSRCSSAGGAEGH